MVTDTIEIDRKLLKKEELISPIDFSKLSQSYSKESQNIKENMASPLFMPDVILIGSLRDRRLKIKKPIKVSFSQSGNTVIAEAEEFNEFGFGNNKTEALNDLQRTVIELFLTLEEDENRIGKDLQFLREKLHNYISLRTP